MTKLVAAVRRRPGMTHAEYAAAREAVIFDDTQAAADTEQGARPRAAGVRLPIRVLLSVLERLGVSDAATRAALNRRSTVVCRPVTRTAAPARST